MPRSSGLAKKEFLSVILMTKQKNENLLPAINYKKTKYIKHFLMLRMQLITFLNHSGSVFLFSEIIKINLWTLWSPDQPSDPSGRQRSPPVVLTSQSRLMPVLCTIMLYNVSKWLIMTYNGAKCSKLPRQAIVRTDTVYWS